MDREPNVGVRRLVYFATAVSALGGLLFGYDIGVISGAILFIKEEFSLSPLSEEIVVSAVLLGSLLGAAVEGTLADRFGRGRARRGPGRKGLARPVPLADKTLVVAEREAEMHLFAAAIGHAKNPTSHRDVAITALESARLIVFASHLFDVVERRSK